MSEILLDDDDVCPWAVWTHRWAHLDEMSDLYQLHYHGDEVYKNISRAPVFFWDMAHPQLLRPFEELWEQWIFPVGVVDGSPFNEHAGYDASVGRVVGESASDRLANVLGIRDRPELKPLFDAISDNDLNGVGNELMSLARSLELRWRKGMLPDDVMNWMFSEFDLRVYYSNKPVPSGSLTIPEVLAAYIAREYGTEKYPELKGQALVQWAATLAGKSVHALNWIIDDLRAEKNKELRYLRKECVKPSAGVSSDILSLSQSLELRFKAGQPLSDILDYFFYEFDLRVEHQRRVWSDEVGAVAKTAQFEKITARGGRTLTLCTIVCEDDAVIDRIKVKNRTGKRPDVTLRFNPATNHTTILGNPKSFVWLEAALRRLRHAEQSARGMSLGDFVAMAKQEKVLGIPWFGHRNQTWLLNIFCGGPRALDTEPSVLAWEVQKQELVEGLKEDNRPPVY